MVGCLRWGSLCLDGKVAIQKWSDFVRCLFKTCKGNLQRVGKIVNSSTATVRQVWVLWETFNTVQAKLQFDLLLSDEETLLDPVVSASDDIKVY